MSVLKRDLLFYGSANMPDVDGVTTGGAVDFSKKVVFADITPTGTISYVSSSSGDVAVTLTQTGRDSTGVIVTENKVLTGTTPVSGSQSFQRLLKGVASGTTAVGDCATISSSAVVSNHTAQAAANSSGVTDASITLQSGDGAAVATGDIIRINNNSPAGVQFQLRSILALSGDIAYVSRNWGTVPTSATTYSIYQGMLFDLSPNQITQIRRPFYNATADVLGGSNFNYYEKIFAVNNNTTIALTLATIFKEADPSGGVYEFALTNILNDTQTIATRQTAPTSGITAFTSGSAPQSINVPSPQNLTPGAAPNAAGAEGVWLSLLLPGGTAPANTFATMRIYGQTT